VKHQPAATTRLIQTITTTHNTDNSLFPSWMLITWPISAV